MYQPVSQQVKLGSLIIMMIIGLTTVLMIFVTIIMMTKVDRYEKWGWHEWDSDDENGIDDDNNNDEN